jgi:hypothetical protein
MVFIHPTILRDSANTSNISHSKYSRMRDAQISQRATTQEEEDVKKDISPMMPRFSDFVKKAPKPEEKSILDSELFETEGGL